MKRLITYELKYNIDLIAPVVILPAAFAIFVVTDTKIFLEIYFLQKYFWAMAVGLGSYLFIYIYLAKRVKEKRDRLFTCLPVSRKMNMFARSLLGIAPFVFIFAFLKLLEPHADKYWTEVIKGLYVQISLLFIFLAAIDFVYELAFVNLEKWEKYRSFIQVGTAAAIAGFSVSIIYLSAIGIIPEWKAVGGEIYIALTGFIIAAGASGIFKKRETYTD
ncbi:MAG: hypothetical protein K9J16_08650 [Melioribacteraceae bacterium]|nr:hypothetical protein [Melioribacteraceae bacterium]MCF8353786.1 hypothetical protein [Melioribacteraceae bacterium]MCF8393622.1 hypothetical protein [Melioribacteraceae bacterium]MCF8419432.1 hypothetical protein [Melioribacteraceae bacterium]